jgi:hypothetical protein
MARCWGVGEKAISTCPQIQLWVFLEKTHAKSCFYQAIFLAFTPCMVKLRQIEIPCP